MAINPEPIRKYSGLIFSRKDQEEAWRMLVSTEGSTLPSKPAPGISCSVKKDHSRGKRAMTRTYSPPHRRNFQPWWLWNTLNSRISAVRVRIAV